MQPALLWTSAGTGTFDDATILNAEYSPSAADITAGTVTLTITAQSAAPCVEASDAMVLTISEQATANAGVDATICEGSTYTMIATATNAASITWSSNGTGTFADATIEDAVYTPSAADRLNGSVTLTMTVTSASPCINATDQMVLIINPQATVNAGADATICETGTYTLSTATQSNATSLAWTTSGDGSFSSTTVLNPIYTPGANDLIAGTVTLTLTAQSAAPCVEASDAMVLTISEQATANAGVDATICEGSTYTMIATATNAASITWSSNGTGTFADATIEDAVYTPSAADILNGSVTLTMTVTSASPCINAVDQMVLSINPQATVSAGADATICETGTYTLSGATSTNATSLLWTSTGTGTFDDATILNAEYSPSAADIAAGTVTLTLTAQSAAPCVEASDAMILTISEQASANAGVDATICEGSTYTMIATATNAASITWSSNGTGAFADATIEDAVYTPSAADILNGTVTLTMTVTSASPCINAVDQMVLSINPQATVNAGADATICETGTYTLSTATQSNATSLAWTTSGDGSFSSTTVLNPIYTPGANDLTAGTVTLTLTAQSAAPCVEASDAMTLTISEQATANAGTDATICEGSTYTMIATATNAASITWSSNGTGTFADATIEDAVYTPSAADILNGTVTLTMTVTSASPCINAVDQMVL
ncbi:MAG: hypothetical protein IPF68_19680, partial [Bacteroidales bacterium]|nr:hypothetical protein [Bacteroidales bacterium]